MIELLSSKVVLTLAAALLGALAAQVLHQVLHAIRSRRIFVRSLQVAAEARRSAFETVRESRPVRKILNAPDQPQLQVERIAIKNFKNIESLDIKLMEPSSLHGNWMCIAGINGAGKSAILQALCAVLLGEKYAAELGETTLRRMIRRTPDGPVKSANIEAWIRRGDAP